MKKILCILLLQIFLLADSFAWGGKWLNEIEYGFILWEVWNVKIITLDKDPYYSLEVWEDKRKYYVFELENYKYFTHRWDETKLLSKWVYVSTSEFSLDMIASEYVKNGWYRPQKWDTIITNYRDKRGDFAINRNTPEKKSEDQWEEEISQVYLKNGITKIDWTGIWIDWVIDCNSLFEGIWPVIFESIWIPYEKYSSEEEKIAIQQKIVNEVIKNGWFCKGKSAINKNLNYIDNKDFLDKEEILAISENNKIGNLYYIIWIFIIFIIWFIIKTKK